MVPKAVGSIPIVRPKYSVSTKYARVAELVDASA